MDKDLEIITAQIIIVDKRFGAVGCRTGKGAGFFAEDEAKIYFARQKAKVGILDGTGEFVLELHLADQVADKFDVNSDGYLRIVGENPKSAEQSLLYDRNYWQKAKMQPNSRKGQLP